MDDLSPALGHIKILCESICIKRIYISIYLNTKIQSSSCLKTPGFILPQKRSPRMASLELVCWLTGEHFCCLLFVLPSVSLLCCEIATGAPAMSPSSRPEEGWEGERPLPSWVPLFSRPKRNFLQSCIMWPQLTVRETRKKYSLIPAALK